MSQGSLHFTPAGTIGRLLIERISDRWWDDGLSAWCELDGVWTAADVPVFMPSAVQRSR